MKWSPIAKVVMPGLVPGIHVLAAVKQEDVDGRDKPGHDEKRIVLKWLERARCGSPRIA
jgi:hypothetical protein